MSKRPSSAPRCAAIRSPRLRVGLGAALLGAALGAVAFGGQASASSMQVVPDGGSFSMQVVSWRDIPFRTVVRQQYDYSCGSAAVATLLRYHYGRPTVESDVFSAMWRSGDQAQIKRAGFSMLDMKRYLDSQGYMADGYRMPLDQLAKLKTPAIALIQIGPYKHFVVIKGVHDDKVLVGDPALGLLTITRPKFQSIWNGIVFAVRKPPASAAAPVFNDQSEWDPWSTAPTVASLPRWALADLTMSMAPMYQLTTGGQTINLRNPTAGVP